MTVSLEPQQARPPRRRTLLVAIPLLVFLGLAALFYIGLYSGDPSRIPSVLIDKPAPTFTLAALEGLTENGAPVPGFSSIELKQGEVSLVNVWASWCGPCRQEHPFLMELRRQGQVRLYGLNYKDESENALRFLTQFGNPYRAVGTDDGGRVAIDWGVYGVPETFVVDGAGVIRYKHIGPLDARSFARLRQVIAMVAAQGSKTGAAPGPSGG